MKRLCLASKISLGYGVVILLLGIISLVSWYGLNDVKDNFVSYRSLAKKTNLAGRLQANMLMVRLNVIDYFSSGDEKAVQAVTDYANQMDLFIEEARKEMRHPERAEKVEFVAEAMGRYKTAFERVKVIRHERDRIMYEVHGVYGPSMETALEEIMNSSEADKNTSAAYEAGIVLRHLLLARLYGQKFLDTNDPEDFARLDTESNKVFKAFSTLDGVLESPDRRALGRKVAQEAHTYYELYKTLASLINERDAIIAGTLEKIGPEVAVAVEDIKLSLKQEQDTLGPIVQSRSQKSIRFILIASCLAILSAIAFGVLLTRSITGPVQQVVGFMEKVAGGDLTSHLKIEQEDEVGKMSDSLSHTVSELGKMIKEIITGVNTLSSSSTELAAISAQLSSTSENAADRADAVASASEEMSVNMGSVSAAMEQSANNIIMIVTAAEEMSATVNGIAQDTAKAKTITENAVIQTLETSGKVNDLGKAADKIGKVTEVITDISEQTNLLALNATIEAARAGDAGKGFAVVANEIKDLAKQTAEATVDIKNQIEGMQETTQSTMSDIQSISEVMNAVNEVIISIATAVEQQSAVTSEISQNVSQASDGINEVNESVAQSSVAIESTNRDIGEISRDSVEIHDSSRNVNQSACELSRLSEQLDALTQRFKVA